MEEPARINGPIDLKKLVDEKGKEWLVAAMVEGSIGYHTPKHAEILIEKALRGETVDWCERCDACFGRDLFEMINYDIRNMPVSYTHLRAHETVLDLVCRLLLEKKKNIQL